MTDCAKSDQPTGDLTSGAADASLWAYRPENYTPLVIHSNHKPLAILRPDGTLEIDWRATESAASRDDALFVHVGILASLMIAVRDGKYVDAVGDAGAVL